MQDSAQREQRKQRRAARKSAAEHKAKRKQRISILGGALGIALLVAVALIIVPSLRNNVSADIEVAEPVSDDIPINGRVLGNPDAPIAVVEWGDYQCPGCAIFNQDFKPQLIADFVETGRIRFEFRDLAFLGDESFQAAEAAACALDQDQFWQYHDTIYTNHNGENQGTYAESRLRAMAEQIGLDMERFDSCLDSGENAGAVDAMIEEARSLGVNRTPSFVINEQVVPFQGYESLRDMIEAALRNQ